MDQRVKALWIGALRSGEFEQGHSRLRTIEDGKPKDCCLGVLCELYRREHPTEVGWRDDGAFAVPTLGTYREEAVYEEYLPDVVVEWAGLPGENPRLGDIEAGVHNDGESWADPPIAAKSFAEIADLIEAHL